jgi:hypothetical protein
MPARSCRRSRCATFPPSCATRSLTGFTGALGDILLVAAVVAFAGALLSLALVRQQDFVAPAQNP